MDPPGAHRPSRRAHCPHGAELGCDRIVLGREDKAAPGLVGKVFGSLAQQVRQLTAGSDCRVIGA